MNLLKQQILCINQIYVSKKQIYPNYTLQE